MSHEALLWKTIRELGGKNACQALVLAMLAELCDSWEGEANLRGGPAAELLSGCAAQVRELLQRATK